MVWISDLSTQKWLSFRNPVHVYSIHPTRRCEKKGNIYAFKGRYLAMPEHTACVHVKRSIEMRFYVMSQMRTILLADAHTVDVKSLLCAFTVSSSFLLACTTFYSTNTCHNSQNPERYIYHASNPSSVFIFCYFWRVAFFCDCSFRASRFAVCILKFLQIELLPNDIYAVTPSIIEPTKQTIDRAKKDIFDLRLCNSQRSQAIGNIKKRQTPKCSPPPVDGSLIADRKMYGLHRPIS